MSHENPEARSALRSLVDTFSNLADEGRIADQMLLLTRGARVQVYMGDDLAFDLAGTDEIQATFAAFAAGVKRSFHLNGQQVVEIDGDAATGSTYCQAKYVSEEDGREVMTDTSIRYEDGYIRQDGRWYIDTRIARFTVIDKRALRS